MLRAASAPIPITIKRIFRTEDAEEISALQKNAGEFRTHYPDHNKWLSKAIREILSGHRTAFGAYAYTQIDPPSLGLVGTCILKPPDLSSTVEIKNLYVHPKYRGNGCGTMLYGEVEQYCGRSGARNIRVELPGVETQTLSWLIKRGFEFLHLRKSVYTPSDSFYELQKALPPFYQGDWFDTHELASWVLTNLYGFCVPHTDDDQKIVFDQRSLTTTALPGLPSIKGCCLCVENVPTLREVEQDISTLSQDYNLVVLFAADEQACPSNLPSNVVVLERNKIRSLQQSSTGDRGTVSTRNARIPTLGYAPPVFSKTEIAGIIVTINSGFLDRFYSTIAKANHFSYFKTGPVGKYAKVNDFLLVYREPKRGSPTEGIFGYAKIDRVIEGTPDHVWQELREENPIMLEEEYRTFWGYKRSIVGIVAQQFKRISEIDHQHLRDLLKIDANVMNLGHCYLSQSMLDALQLEKKVQGGSLYDVAISFAGPDRNTAKQLFQLLETQDLKVFYDEDAERMNLGTNAMGTLFDVFSEQSSFVVVLCSRSIADSPWAQYEISLAINREQRQRAQKRGLILPVRIDDAEVPYLTDRIYCDLTHEDLRAAAAKISAHVRNSRVPKRD